jgi:hypothetical protein
MLDCTFVAQAPSLLGWRTFYGRTDTQRDPRPSIGNVWLIDEKAAQKSGQRARRLQDRVSHPLCHRLRCQPDLLA